MKKMYVMFAAVFIMYNANAQTKFGMKAGLNFASQKLSGSGMTLTSSSLTGVHLGAFANIKVSDKFNVQPELLYSGVGSKWSIMSSSTKSTLNYIAIPVVAQFKPIEKLYIEGGPQIGFLLSAKSEAIDIKDDFKSTDFQFLLGAGYYFTDKISAGVRYGTSLGDIAAGNSGDGSVKNRVISLGFAYSF